MHQSCSLLSKRIYLALLLLLSFSIPVLSEACSRALWNNSLGIYIGQNMDWPNDLKTTIWVSPRGLHRSGGADENSVEWVANYGSVTARGFGIMTTNGMNEKGLAAHTFWLDETNYGNRDVSIPGLSVVMWAQFYLDSFANVEEAVRYTEGLANSNKPAFQIESLESIAGSVTLHLILDDASGDTAIIEYINGKPKVYHSRHYISVTNSPTYDKQLANLGQYQGFGGAKSLPGTSHSLDRFVRTAYYASHLPDPTNQAEAVAEILSVMNNVAAPYGASSLEKDVVSRTVWHTVADLTHRIFYYQSTTSGMNLLWVPMDSFHFEMGAPEYRFDPAKNLDAAGDISKRFKQNNNGMRMMSMEAGVPAQGLTASTKSYLKQHILAVN